MVLEARVLKPGFRLAHLPLAQCVQALVKGAISLCLCRSASEVTLYHTRESAWSALPALAQVTDAGVDSQGLARHCLRGSPISGVYVTCTPHTSTTTHTFSCGHSAGDRLWPYRCEHGTKKFTGEGHLFTFLLAPGGGAHRPGRCSGLPEERGCISAIAQGPHNRRHAGEALCTRGCFMTSVCAEQETESKQRLGRQPWTCAPK